MRILTCIIVLFLSANLLAQNSHLVQSWFHSDPLVHIEYAQTRSFLPETDYGQKNKGKAFFLSLLIPGLGQRYTEANKKMIGFFAAEVGLWMTFSGYKMYSNWKQQDYHNYAARYAGVDLNDKSESYFINVGNFNSIYEYNAYKLQWRQLDEYYKDVEQYYWDWQSEEHRNKFDQLRISSDTAHNRATLILGFIMANHVISAIDALITANRYNNQQTAMDWNFYLGDGRTVPYVNLSLSAHW